MAVTFYSWEDAGAPQFTSYGLPVGTNNVIEVLDAILISGYGVKPALGWTKFATSSINDRAVYQNQSAYNNNMSLIVQSNPNSGNSTLWQIADSVTSPEDYYGYSSVASLGCNYGISRWWAVGDERTLVFIIGSLHMEGSNFYSYYPNILYVGDFEGSNNPSCWGLLAAKMSLGTMDNVSENGLTYGALNSVGLTYQEIARPLTTMHEQAWSESNMKFNVSSYMQGSFITTGYSIDSGYQDVDDFLANVGMRAPWYIYLNYKWFYRLRGTYSLTPELHYFNKTTNKTNTLKPFTIDGTDYVISGIYSGLCFQISGDW